YAKAPVIMKQRREYRWWIGLAGGALIAGSVALSLVVNAGVLSVVTVVVALVVFFGGFVRARHAIRAVKQREQWYAGLRQGVATDTTLRTEPGRFPWAWAIPALVVLAATVVTGIVRYPSLPDTLVMHYNADGVADRVVRTTPATAFVTVIVQAGLTAFLLLVLGFSFRARPDLDAAAPVKTARQHRGFRERMIKALLLVTGCVNVSMFVLAWQIWDGGRSVSLVAILVPVLVGLVILIWFAVRTGQSGSRLAADEVAEDTGVVQRDDDKFWHGAGGIYVNRKDPALFLPKRFGIGWTFNFGNPRVLLILAPLVAIVVLSIVLGR
ncbi:MAG TPA: DUF5808 domain-containing protein, partial [Amycolatopsis sp.]|nr:DUF5808 domain-containing protein [Amycolatopsis sp.]